MYEVTTRENPAQKDPVTTNRLGEYKLSNQPYHRLASTIAVLLACLLASCASFKGGELPERTRDDFTAPASLHSASLDFTWLTQSKVNPTVRELYAPKVIGVMEESGLFSKVKEGDPTADYQFSISIDNTGNRFVAGLTGFLSGLTLFALPGYARDNYTLEAEVHRNGVLVRKASYQDHVTSWFQWIMLFFSFTHKLSEVPDEVIENTIWNLLYDLQQEQVFSGQ